MIVVGDVWKVFSTPTPTLRGGGVWDIVGEKERLLTHCTKGLKHSEDYGKTRLGQAPTLALVAAAGYQLVKTSRRGRGQGEKR